MSILCIGEMLIDFTPAKDMKNTYTANPGGAPANVAVSVARNEVKSGFLGKLGNDDFGRLLKKTLEDDKVEILCPELTDKATTTLAFVSLDEHGDRSFTFARKPGADMLLNTSDVEKIDFNQWDIVHAGSVSQSGSPEKDAVLLAVKKAKACGKTVSFDINFRDKIWGYEECKSEVEKIMPYVDLLKISDEELDFVDGEKNIPLYMYKYGIKVVVLTMGGEGITIYLFNNPEIRDEKDNKMVDCTKIHLAAMNVPEVKDTTGAGDAFWGAFLSSLVRQGVKRPEDIDKEILKEAGLCGNISGGLCITKPGGIPAIPTLKEINSIERI